MCRIQDSGRPAESPSLPPCLCPLAASPVRGVCDGCRVARSRIVVGRLLDLRWRSRQRPTRLCLAVCCPSARLPIRPSAHPIPPPGLGHESDFACGSLEAKRLGRSPARRLVASLLRRTAQQATHCGIYLVQDDAVPPSCWSKTRPAGAASTLHSALAGTAYMSAWRDAWIRPPSPLSHLSGHTPIVPIEPVELLVPKQETVEARGSLHF